MLSFFGAQVDKLYDALAQSTLARFLCGYDKLGGLANDSFFVGLAQRVRSVLKKKIRKPPRREIGSETLGHEEVGIFAPSSLHKSLKTRLSEAVEESVIIEKAVGFLRSLLLVPMISYGVFLFAFGLSTTVIQALVFFLQGEAPSAALDLFTGLALVLLSLPVMFKGYEPLIESLKKSVLGSRILHSMFGIDHSSEVQKSTGSVNFLLFLAGVICGAMTWLLPPMRLVILGVIIAVAIGVIFVPEAGVLLLFACFPFLGYLPHTSVVCGAAVAYIGICWLIKVALGKRSFSVDLSDVLVLALMLIVFIAAFADQQDSMQSGLLYLALMAGYFIISNLLRSKLWIRRTSDGLIFSSIIVSAVGLVQWFWKDAVTSVFDSGLMLGCYLLAIIPMVLVKMSATSHKHIKFRYLLILMLHIGTVLAGGSRLVMLVCLIELLIYRLLSSRKTLSNLLILVLLLPIAACALPLFPDLLPALTRPLAEGRQEATLELLTLIGKAPLTGIGMSDSMLTLALPTDGLGALPELGNTFLRLALQIGLPGLLIFLLAMLVWYIAGFSLIQRKGTGRIEKCYIRGAITSLTAMFFMGTFCYLWADYRLLMLFWGLAGLYQAVRKYSIEHENQTTDEEIPAEDVQWVNLDLYFDGAGKPKGYESRMAESNKGGNEK